MRALSRSGSNPQILQHVRIESLVALGFTNGSTAAAPEASILHPSSDSLSPDFPTSTAPPCST